MIDDIGTSFPMMNQGAFYLLVIKTSFGNFVYACVEVIF
jgi:hypothetical protein